MYINRNTKKAVSTFIAVIILMVLAVTAGILIYAYTMGYLGNFGESEGKGSMLLESANINIYLSAYIKNNGQGTLIIDTIYIDNVKQAIKPKILIDGVNSPDGSLKEGETAEIIYYYSPNGYTTGKTYSIKLVSKDGVQLTFNVKAE